MPFIKIRCILLCLICCGATYFSVGAQQYHSVVIQVEDNQRKVLEAVQVSLWDSTRIISFGFTEATGQLLFEIPLQEVNDLTLHFNYLGYESQQIKLNSDFLSKSFLRVSLIPSIFHLTEVEIAGKKLPISYRNDTLVYQADDYRDGMEKKLESLLKKMPGIEVEDNGKILVQGKEVSTILIEGDDVFGTNYRLGSQNMSANLVEEVEVIDHYADDIVMKGLVRTNEAVLNLKLKSEKKQFAFGELLLSHGLRGATDNQINLFALKQSTKFFLLGNNNSIGLPTLTALDISYATGEQQANSTDPLINKGLIEEVGLPQPGFMDPARTNNNQAAQGAMVILLKPAQNLKIRTLIYGAKERNQLLFLQKSDYFQLRDSLSIFQNHQWKQRLSTLYFETKLKYVINNCSKLEANWSSQFDDRSSSSNILSKINRDKSHLNTLYHNKPKGDLLKILYAYRLNKNLALQLVAKGKFSYSDQRNKYDEIRYSKDEIAGGSSSHWTQMALQHYNKYQSDLSFIFQLNRWKGTIGYGFQLYESKNNAELLTDQLEINSILDTSLSLANRTAFGWSEQHLRLQLNRKFGPLKLSTQLKLTHGAVQLRDPIQNRIQQKEYIRLLPLIDLDYKFSKRASFSFSWQKKVNFPEEEQLFSGYYFEGFRTLKTGINSLPILPLHTLNFKYRFVDAFDQLSLSLTYQYTSQQLDLGEVITPGLWYDRVQLFLNNESKSHLLRLNLDKYIAGIKGLINIQVNGIKTNNENGLNQLTFRSKMTLMSLGINYRLQWRKFIKPYLRFKYSYQGILLDTPVDETNSVSNFTLNYGGGITFQILEKALFQIDLNGIVPGQSANSESALFFDTTLKIPLKNITFLATATNLLNQKELGVYQGSFYYQQVINYRLRPRTFLLGVQWNF